MTLHFPVGWLLKKCDRFFLSYENFLLIKCDRFFLSYRNLRFSVPILFFFFFFYYALLSVKIYEG